MTPAASSCADGSALHVVRAVLCTGNAHKVTELAELLAGIELGALPDSIKLPPETGTTFEANARIKAAAGAEHHAAASGLWSIADDSGLTVTALNDEPGVYSARFAGENATDDDNVALLLERLAGESNRAAAFHCVLVAIAPDGRELVARGRVDGTIAHAPSGDSGFGYDPVFVPVGHDESFAVLGAELKASISHRAHAAAELAQLLGAPAAARSNAAPSAPDCGTR
ncbi:MAG: RdgB/HAM1 family non-canonical purine NTP pyrophosphatase [Thermoleophilia bacterium]|nr:RdgB/HAM1 family non-canonical purine NTP pyrophosphatase [Thermoleophilia bacterium]